MSIKLTMKQSSILASVSKGTMFGVQRSPSVDALVSKGYATHDPKRKTLEITEAGERFLRGVK
ncbi:hypothetical protein WKW50_16370 [Ochrobactrum sp. GPK 3]